MHRRIAHPRGRRCAHDGGLVRIVSNGNGYLTAWGGIVDDAGTNTEVYVRPLDASGMPIAPAKRITTAPGVSLGVSLVWTGTQYGLAWHDGRETAVDASGGSLVQIYFARLDANGDKIGNEVKVSSTTGAAFRPALAWTGTHFGVTWNDSRDGNQEIYFGRLDANGAVVGGDVRVTNATGNSLFSGLAAAGSTGYGAVWVDTRDGNDEIYLSRLTIAGAPGPAVRLTTTPTGSYSTQIVWNGTGFAAVWVEGNGSDAMPRADVVFARLDDSGARIGADLAVRSGVDGLADLTAMVWTGSEYGIAWRDPRSGGAAGEVYFSRVSAAGVEIGMERNLTMDALDTSQLWLTGDSARYAAFYHSAAVDNSVAGKYFLAICP